MPDNRPLLTAIVLTHDESSNLGRCLESLRFCDSVIVVDDNSTDDTTSIAKKHGAKVVIHGLSGDFASARNWAVQQASTPWIFFVDADEVVPEPLASEIILNITSTQFTGYFVPRIDFMWGRQLKHGDLRGASFLRLSRRGTGKWVGKVHETQLVDGKVGVLQNPLHHFPHPTMTAFLTHINHYSSLRAQEFYDQGRRTNQIEIIFAPVTRFIQLYIFKLGFLDGTPGFIHAMTMAFYAFLVAGKLYLLSKGIPK